MVLADGVEETNTLPRFAYWCPRSMVKDNEIQNERRNDDYTVIRRRDRRMDSLVTLLTVCVLVCVSSITSSNALLTPFPRRRGISRSSQPVIMWRGAATQSPLCQSPSPTTEISRPTNTSVVLVGDGNSDDDLILNGADESALELPIPTANGGFSHTNASKAKISAANRGKVPWNKGRAQSDAVRAKIAAGVQKRNREKFLKSPHSIPQYAAPFNQRLQPGGPVGPCCDDSFIS